MKLILSFLVVFASLSLLTSTAAKPDPKGQILRALRRREMALEQREVQYHKQLQEKQEKRVAALGRPKALYRDTPTNPDDRDALEDLYQSTHGSKWLNNTGWMTGDPCTYPFWFGIYCIEGRVLQINMAYNGLTGSLPSSLARASALQVVRLYSNALTGEIPPGIFALRSLQIFNVNSNQLTGKLPSIDMPNLTELTLYDNSIGGDFPSTFNAPNLQLLEVSSNSFTGNLPEGLSASTGLTQLVVSRNSFTGTLPDSYGSLTKLERLWTFYNNLDRPQIPNSYRNLVNLVEVQADGLFGPLPEWIGSSWRKMKLLILINGGLSGGFPESLCNCKEMVSLRIFNNSLKGELPDCICGMQKLTDLELSDNQFTGQIPDNFQDCRSLENLILSRNNFTGTFPRTLSKQENLTIVDVSMNGLYGTIPNTINNLNEEISEFAVSYNMFSDVENGVDDFFKRITDYSCIFYDNPWSCPMSTEIPKECGATCSKCNAKAQHASCSDCIKSSDCGWCQKGSNCLKGGSQGPETYYKCLPGDWTITC